MTILSFTDDGDSLAELLVKSLKSLKKSGENLSNARASQIDDVSHLPRSASRQQRHESIQSAFTTSEPLIFISSTGIAIRMIAPYINSKFFDPPVILISDDAKNVICLLSGHIGGGHRLSEIITETLNNQGLYAQNIITTATEIRGKQSVEQLLAHLNIDWLKYRETLIKANSLIANGEKLSVSFDERLGSPLTKISKNTLLTTLTKPQNHDFFIIPRQVIIGTGTKRNLEFSKYLSEFEIFLTQAKLSRESIFAIATIDIKKNEACILRLADLLGAKLLFYTAEELEKVSPLFEGSEFVQSVVGTPSVACASAYLSTYSELAKTRYTLSGCTFAYGILKGDI